MSWPFRKAFRLPLGKRAVRGDVAAELEFHIQGRIEELMAAGLSRTEAEREARTRFGDLPRIGAELERIDPKGRPTLKDIFRFKDEGEGGQFAHTGYVPAFVEGAPSSMFRA